MNSYDQQALDAIQAYHAKHGEYPKQIETTFECLEQLSQEIIIIEPDPDTGCACKTVSIPVVPLRETVHRKMILRQVGTRPYILERLIQEAYQDLEKQLTSKGLIVHHTQETGLENACQFFHQLTIFVYGNEQVLQQIPELSHGKEP